MLSELASLYDSDRTALVVTMAEAAIDRLRTLTLRAFSDAFGGENDKGTKR